MNIRCEISGGLYSSVSNMESFPILLFVGSDKVTGDALAPICGSILKSMGAPLFIYGDLESPINAVNLNSTVQFVKKLHPNVKILVVDASVGIAEDVGRIKFLPCGIKPGKAVGREFPSVGDMAIAGIVSSKNTTSNTIAPVRLFDVYLMAEEIAREIYICARSFFARGGKKSHVEKKKNPLEGVWR